MSISDPNNWGLVYKHHLGGERGRRWWQFPRMGTMKKQEATNLSTRVSNNNSHRVLTIAKHPVTCFKYENSLNPQCNARRWILIPTCYR